MNVVDRFLNYVKFDTQSDELTNLTPSTPGQMIFAQQLKKELKSMGLSDITLDDVDVASSIISAAADADANIIFGVAFDEKLDDEIVVTVIATGFGTDINGLANKAGAGSDDSLSSGASGDDDDIVDILDLFKGRK